MALPGFVLSAEFLVLRSNRSYLRSRRKWTEHVVAGGMKRSSEIPFSMFTWHYINSDPDSVLSCVGGFLKEEQGGTSFKSEQWQNSNICYLWLECFVEVFCFAFFFIVFNQQLRCFICQKNTELNVHWRESKISEMNADFSGLFITNHLIIHHPEGRKCGVHIKCSHCNDVRCFV